MPSPSDERIRVLLVEDSEDDAKLTQRALRQGGLDAKCERVDSAASLQLALDSRTWDAVISDYNLPGFTGLDALGLCRAAGLDIPFILISGAVGEEIAVEAMKAGAGDYIMKQNLARLAPALERELKDAAMRVQHRDTEDQLRRLRMAMDVTTDSIFLTDAATFRFVYVNDAACKRLGYSREQLMQMGPQDVVKADREQIRREFEEVIAAGDRGTSIEHQYIAGDGRQGWSELKRRALRAESVTLIVTIGRDITERKRADERIRRLNRIYAVLSGVNSAIVRIRERAELFREVCGLLMKEGGLVLASIGLADPLEQRLNPFGLEGVDAEFMEGLRNQMSLRDDAPGGYGASATAFREKRIVIVNDVENDAVVLYTKEHAARGIRSLAILPLYVAGEPVGVLGLYASDAGFFDDEEMKLLTELAGDVSFALDNFEKQKKLDYLVFYDQLTGLTNRPLFLERVDQAIHVAAQNGDKFTLAVLDIERIRTINESLGRHAGDELLKLVAQRLNTTGTAAGVSRVGADQFALVLDQIKGGTQADRMVNDAMQAFFGKPFQVEGTELRISAKAGVALYPEDGTDAESLLRNAEAALRKAKELGERHVFYTAAMTERTAGQLKLENQLRQALEKNEFVLHYQPKVDLENRGIVGVEALIRWQSPTLGLVPPVQFIPLMEETGLIVEVGAWALGQAVADHARWLEQGIEAPRVAVNVSAIQLRGRNFLATLEQALGRGATPPGIDLEITESLIMEDIKGSIEKLKAARDLGMCIAIDDFGTGYSSLAYLARLPVHTLKIDRSFVITMLNDPDTMTLVSTIISLAHSLRLKVVAEGVDEKEQEKTLRLMRCDEMQGYLFSRPLDFEQMTEMLLREENRGR